MCRYKKVEIIEGAVCVDHVHLCLAENGISVPKLLDFIEAQLADGKRA